MNYRHIVCILIIVPTLISHSLVAFAQTQLKEEREEKTLEIRKIQKNPPTLKLFATCAQYFGFDTNALLASTRKGDLFEEFLFSTDVEKKWPHDIKFTIAYDFDYLNYNEYTDNTSMLNHFRAGPHKKFGKYNIGTGYDLGVYYYPFNEDGTFVFNKGFIYISQDITKKLYHRLLVEAGLKNYTDNLALGDTITTRQDKERADRRLDAEYRVIALPHKRLLLNIKTKFSSNKSNARYVDFYDYKSYEESIRADYKIFKNLKYFGNFIYIRKIFDERTVTNADYRERDSLYAGNTGFTYMLNKKALVTLYYTYRQNSSNDNIQRYSESVITCGMQYNF